MLKWANNLANAIVALFRGSDFTLLEGTHFYRKRHVVTFQSWKATIAIDIRFLSSWKRFTEFGRLASLGRPTLANVFKKSFELENILEKKVHRFSIVFYIPSTPGKSYVMEFGEHEFQMQCSSTHYYTFVATVFFLERPRAPRSRISVFQPEKRPV